MAKRVIKPNLVKEPKTIFEAREQLAKTQAEIDIIERELNQTTRLDAQGNALDAEAFISWKGRATGALRHLLYEKAYFQQWIRDYNADVEQEDRAERQRAHQERVKRDQEAKAQREAARADRHALLLRAKALSANDEEILPDDDANLLRHAYRLLSAFARDNRVTYTEQEQALKNIIRKRVRQHRT